MLIKITSRTCSAVIEAPSLAARMRPVARDSQAATDCGGWRGGHNGGDDAAKVSPQGTAMSALRPEADIWAGLQQVRFVPKRSLIYLHFTEIGL